MARGSRGSKKMMKSLMSKNMLTYVLLAVIARFNDIYSYAL